jgi:hypothetical protein
VSFHADVISPWTSDLETAGVAATGAIYTGRRRQHPARVDPEIWIERLPIEQEGTGLQAVTRHPYLVHLYVRNTAGPAQAGDAQLALLEERLEIIIRRYHGTCPFVATVTDMVHCTAVGESVDVDPENKDIIEGTVRVTFEARG